MTARYRAYVCCGPNCGPRGSSQLLDFLSEEVERLGLAGSVTVLPTGCQSHCESGPTMVVYPGPVYYEGVDATRIKHIAEAHLQGGRPVEEYFWRGKPGKLRPPRPYLSTEAGAQPTASRSAQATTARPKPPPRDVDDFKW